MLSQHSSGAHAEHGFEELLDPPLDPPPELVLDPLVLEALMLELEGGGGGGGGGTGGGELVELPSGSHPLLDEFAEYPESQ
ncbi:hypothetical protein EBU95_20045 [bacterium]|nr:hypothetical protein [bacterium]